MATTTKSPYRGGAAAANDPRQNVGTPPSEEPAWNASKLIVVGILTLIASFAFLWFASPTKSPH